MSVTEPTAGLTREEKRELLRQALLEQMARPRTAPASLAQEGLWFLDRMEGAGAAYNFPVALRLRGALDVAALERALGEIVRRHETLRTTLAEHDGAPVQVIAPVQGFALAVEDASEAEATWRKRRARPSTWPPGRSSARGCCASPGTTTCCWPACTTW